MNLLTGGLSYSRKGDRKMQRKTIEERLYELVQEYTVQDIERVLGARLAAAGLILFPALAGMVALGRSLYGYGLDDRAAFLKFARYRMKLNGKLAGILHDNVYKGLARQWCVETRVTFHSAFKEWLAEGSYWYKIEGSEIESRQLHISATGLAGAYMEAVKRLPEYSKTPQHSFIDEEEEFQPVLRKQVADFISMPELPEGGAVIWEIKAQKKE